MVSSRLSNPLESPAPSLCRFLWLTILLYTMAPECASEESEAVPTVEVMQGSMSGSLMRTAFGGRKVASYRGIPYAEPPIGELRFRAPEPLNGWEGILDAREDPPPCIQKDLIFNIKAPVIGEEDCLYLNVYVPLDIIRRVKESEKDVSKLVKLPVMVFIHGGGWLGGSGTSFNFGPDLLLDEDVVLVTINYRLSAFGFLSTGDNASPGNYGLKDQTLALKWINENIAAFGGDYNKVTIFGQSAGAASVHYHILSPLSKGLFQNAISHSGNALAPWALARDAPTNAKTLARLLNCPTDQGSDEMVKCLRSKPASEVAEKFENFVRWDMDPLLVFCPSIESEGQDEKPFISEHPYRVMKSGRFNRVNWMAGATREDGSFRTATILSDDKKAKEIDEEFVDFVGPLSLRLEESAKDPKGTAKQIRKVYFGDEAIGVETHKKLTELFSDRYFFNGLVLSMNVMSKFRSKIPAAYLYQFSHRGRYSLVDGWPVINKTTNTVIDTGVTHCDDLMYLFPIRDYAKGPLEGGDAQMSKVMVKMWTDFAKEGNPTPSLSDLIPIKWDAVKSEDINLMEMGASPSPSLLKMRPICKGYLKRYKFWRSLKLNEDEYYKEESKRDEL